MNIPMVGLFVRVLLVPPRILMPVVAMVSFVGIYGISGSSFDLMVMIVFGVLGWFLRKIDVPLVPVILGILLGNQMEANLRRAMTISDGDWSALVQSNLAIGLWVVSVTGFILPILFGSVMRRRMAVRAHSEEAIGD
jgi:putative tricarboxylic transport membrane protein